MATVLRAWPYGRSIQVQSNLRRKKLYRPFFSNGRYLESLELQRSVPFKVMSVVSFFYLLQEIWFRLTKPLIFEGQTKIRTSRFFLHFPKNLSTFQNLRKTQHYIKVHELSTLGLMKLSNTFHPLRPNNRATWKCKIFSYIKFIAMCDQSTQIKLFFYIIPRRRNFFHIIDINHYLLIKL